MEWTFISEEQENHVWNNPDYLIWDKNTFAELAWANLTYTVKP